MTTLSKRASLRLILTVWFGIVCVWPPTPTGITPAPQADTVLGRIAWQDGGRFEVLRLKGEDAREYLEGNLNFSDPIAQRWRAAYRLARRHGSEPGPVSLVRYRAKRGATQQKANLIDQLLGVKLTAASRSGCPWEVGVEDMHKGNRVHRVSSSDDCEGVEDAGFYLGQFDSGEEDRIAYSHDAFIQTEAGQCSTYSEGSFDVNDLTNSLVVDYTSQNPVPPPIQDDFKGIACANGGAIARMIGETAIEASLIAFGAGLAVCSPAGWVGKAMCAGEAALATFDATYAVLAAEWILDCILNWT